MTKEIIVTGEKQTRIPDGVEFLNECTIESGTISNIEELYLPDTIKMIQIRVLQDCENLRKLSFLPIFIVSQQKQQKTKKEIQHGENLKSRQKALIIFRFQKVSLISHTYYVGFQAQEHITHHSKNLFSMAMKKNSIQNYQLICCCFLITKDLQSASSMK